MPNQLSSESPERPCDACNGTGMTELVMTDLSREPWPCPYCEAGARIRDSLEELKNCRIEELKD